MKYLLVGSVPNNENLRNTMDIFSCSFDNDEILNEQNNELIDKVNLSSLSYIQTKQRRIDHRRNKSEPLIRGNIQDNISSINSNRLTLLESSSTSTNSNESSISFNNSFENKTKYSKTKNFSPTTNIKQIQDKPSSTNKKKKPWYNVSIHILTLIKSFNHLFRLHLNTFSSYGRITDIDSFEKDKFCLDNIH